MEKRLTKLRKTYIQISFETTDFMLINVNPTLLMGKRDFKISRRQLGPNIRTINLLTFKGVMASASSLTRVLFTNTIFELAFGTDVGVFTVPRKPSLPL